MRQLINAAFEVLKDFTSKVLLEMEKIQSVYGSQVVGSKQRKIAVLESHLDQAIESARECEEILREYSQSCNSDCI